VIATSLVFARGDWSVCLELREHSGSGQDQVRLRHTTRTGRPKHGASTRWASRRPWLTATTPHAGQPTTVGADSTLTTNRSGQRSTCST